MPNRFLDAEHEAFYRRMIVKAEIQGDPYREALFYTLGLTDETRRNIGSLYDFKERCISFEGQHAAWQTSTTGRVTHLAFNLYNGYSGSLESGESGSEYTPYNIFCDQLREYMFEAVRILYGAT
jgi:hypothetical protein